MPVPPPQDPATQRPRGYLRLAPRAPIPVTFTLDISHPLDVWMPALRWGRGRRHWHY